jgi:thiamine biosynthesis lipoprotein
MRETRLVMGMPVTVDIVGAEAPGGIEATFAYFVSIDERFSPYKPNSELSAMNRGEHAGGTLSPEMHEVLMLAELTRHETRGVFDIRRPDGRLDPSGIVKGWAIRNAARRLDATGLANYCIEAGGDIQCRGHNQTGAPWRIGIRNPFDDTEIVKVLTPGDCGVATSGDYVRGQHIYDPRSGAAPDMSVASLTVVGPDIYEADRFATAAFAMGPGAIGFIEETHGLEGYAIDRNGVATMTSGFNRMVAP